MPHRTRSGSRSACPRRPFIFISSGSPLRSPTARAPVPPTGSRQPYACCPSMTREPASRVATPWKSRTSSQPLEPVVLGTGPRSGVYHGDARAMHEREHASLDADSTTTLMSPPMSVRTLPSRVMDTRVANPLATVHALRHVEAQRAEVAEVRLDLREGDRRRRRERQQQHRERDGRRRSRRREPAADAARRTTRRARREPAIDERLRGAPGRRRPPPRPLRERRRIREYGRECSSVLLLGLHGFERFARAMHTDADVVFRDAERAADRGGREPVQVTHDEARGIAGIDLRDRGSQEARGFGALRILRRRFVRLVRSSRAARAI